MSFALTDGDRSAFDALMTELWPVILAFAKRTLHAVADAEFKSEAAQLHEKAASHRKLAQMYRTHTPPKGGASYADVAKHCDSLANYYEQAAKEAEAVSTELAK